MGQSQNNQHPFQAIIMDESYGQGKLVSINGNQAIFKTQILQDQLLKKYEQEFENMKNIGIQTIVKSQYFQKSNHTDLCSNYIQIVIAYRYYQKNLKDQFKFMIKNSLRYTQGQLIYFIDCVLSGLISLKQHQIFEYILNPINILISKQRIYRLLYKMGKHCDRDINIVTNMDENMKDTYLSPQIIQAYAKKGTIQFNQYINQKNNVYAIGLIILQMGLSMTIHQYYDFKKLKLNNEFIQYLIQAFSGYFSKLLTTCVARSLDRNLSSRLNYNGLYQLLEPILDNMNKESIKYGDNYNGIFEHQNHEYNTISLNSIQTRKTAKNYKSKRHLFNVDDYIMDSQRVKLNDTQQQIKYNIEKQNLQKQKGHIHNQIKKNLDSKYNKKKQKKCLKSNSNKIIHEETKCEKKQQVPDQNQLSFKKFLNYVMNQRYNRQTALSHQFYIPI